MEIPPYFAIFDDSGSYGTAVGRLAIEQRFAIATATLDPVTSAYKVANLPFHVVDHVTQGRVHLVETPLTVPNTAIKTRLQPPGRFPSEFIVWKLPWTILHPNLQEPVQLLGMDRISGLEMKFCYTAFDDTLERCLQRGQVARQVWKAQMEPFLGAPIFPAPSPISSAIRAARTRRPPTPVPADTAILNSSEEDESGPALLPVRGRPATPISLSPVASAPRPPPPPTPRAPPAFVAEALIRDARASAATCPVSMTPLSECAEVAITPCFHLFEAASIRSWMVSHSACPVCKQNARNFIVLPGVKN